jgi:hypothetical protein
MTTPLLADAAAAATVKGREIGGRAARDAARARVPTGNRQYQGVILAEFLTAALIVALAPVARGKAAQDQTAAPSPYGVDDLKQLVGLGAVYFILALLSSGKWGRLSAWFGGLILILILLGQTESGGLPAIFGIFQPAGLSGKSAGPFHANQPVFANPALPFEQPGQQGPFTTIPAPDVTGIFPIITPGGQVIPGGVAYPTPTGAPSFTQQVTQAGGGLAAAYTGGPGVVTTDTGTQLA